MSTEELSRRRGATSEITFLAPIRRGLVPLPPSKLQLSYSDRLKIVLEAFNDREDGYDGRHKVPLALRAFRGIHFAHLVMLDGDTRFLFSVDFDGSTYDYLAGLSCDVPHLLHLVFSHCVGWESVADDPGKLVRFVQCYQVKTNFWYAHAPSITIRDVEWLDALRRELESQPAAAQAGVSAQLLSTIAQKTAPRTVKRGLAQLFDSQPDPMRARAEAKGLFLKLFAPMFADSELAAAYRETFDEDLGAQS